MNTVYQSAKKKILITATYNTSSFLFDSVSLASLLSRKVTYNMDMIRNNSQGALHCFPAQVQMSRPFLSSMCRHGDEARESMSIDDHLDQMFQLIISALTPLARRITHTMQSFGLGDPYWISGICSFSIIMPIPRQQSRPFLK
jgi:hypothetical protein